MSKNSKKILNTKVAEKNLTLQRRLFNERIAYISLEIMGFVFVVLLISVSINWQFNKVINDSEDLTIALKENRWADALALDEKNLSALAGRARQRLNKSVPDITGAFSDIELIEKIDPSFKQLTDIKIMAYKTRIQSFANEGKIKEALQDLSYLEKNGVSEDLRKKLMKEIQMASPQNGVDINSAQHKKQPKPKLAEQVTSPSTVLKRPSLLSTPFGIKVAKEAQQSWAAYLGKPPIIKNELGMEFVLIPPGEYLMGSPTSEQGRADDEVQHKVQISEPFYLGKTEVTQKQWREIMRTTPWSSLSGVQEDDESPAVYVAWSDVHAFIGKLNQKDKAKYRLPTEPEWEYACRAGSDKAYCFGEELNERNKYAWFDLATQNSRNEHAQKVGLKLSNQFGLFDMHGNVWELCEDTYLKDYIVSENDQNITDNDKYVVIRGGSWTNKIEFCRSAYRGRGLRSYRGNDLGFRLVLIP